jgi:hypothetical protein
MQRPDINIPSVFSFKDINTSSRLRENRRRVRKSVRARLDGRDDGLVASRGGR